ncbi:MAG: Gfo/Idh/MocA family oxidoreductase [Candidatus Omnitrophica bacterium]|nr:Gfo/Idh/MocA family oxidoreductase [Candidatus Omnitrophota bacterium]
MKDVLKCGIIGYGYMGEIRRRVVESLPGLKLVGICEVQDDVREKIQDVPAFKSYEELLKQDVDIIFVCTPNCFSPEIAMRAMDLGKHVFCEKPPGRNVQDILDMRAHEKKGVKLMFGFNHRYHPGIAKAKVLIESGRVGKIIGLRGVYGKSGGAKYHESWRNKKEISGGGILLDQGIHMLDLFRYFCDDFEHVKCFVNTAFWKFDLEDNAFVILQNHKGQTASLHSSATLWRHTFQMNIILEEGYMIVEGLLSKTGSYGREKLIVAKRQFEDEAEAVGNPSEEVTYFDRDLSWDIEVDEFVKCIQENKAVTMSSSHDALRVMEIIEQAYKDAESNLVSEGDDEKHCHF